MAHIHHDQGLALVLFATADALNSGSPAGPMSYRHDSPFISQHCFDSTQLKKSVKNVKSVANRAYCCKHAVITEGISVHQHCGLGCNSWIVRGSCSQNNSYQLTAICIAAYTVQRKYSLTVWQSLVLISTDGVGQILPSVLTKPYMQTALLTALHCTAHC